MSAIALVRSIVVVLALAGLAACAHRPGPAEGFRDCADCPEMVAIPTVSAAAGSPESAQPAFAIGRTEVTFAQWEACAAGGGCSEHTPGDMNWGRGNRPVIDVSWHDAQAYVQWLSQRTGEHYRLPSAAEWEIAARAGSTTIYSWGDQDPVCDERAPNGANFYVCEDDRTRPVGSFRPNAFGLFDLQGNVEEWVEDCDTEECLYRAMRGGSWSSDDTRLRSGERGGTFPVYRFESVGFRVARDM